MSLPRYSYDLVYQLARDIPEITAPTTGPDWAALDDRRVRYYAYHSGRRSVVDELLTILTEQEDANADPVEPTEVPEHDGDQRGSPLSYRVLAAPRVVGGHVEATLDLGNLQEE